MNVYVTDHPHSQVLCRAFAEGSKGRLILVGSLPQHGCLPLPEGPAAVYGILRGCDRIIRQCDWVLEDFYHIDHGYLRRGHYHGYYRVSRNALQSNLERNANPERFEALGLDILPWRKTGTSVVIAPMPGAIGRFLNVNTRDWTQAVIREVKRFTDRPVVIKEKDAGSIEDALSDAWCLVTHSSNAAVDALRMGVPVITLGHSAVSPLSWDFETIEEPVWPERDWAFHALANHQWTIAEMENGTCWRMLCAD